MGRRRLGRVLVGDLVAFEGVDLGAAAKESGSTETKAPCNSKSRKEEEREER